MRTHSFFIGSLTAVIAFGILYLILCQNGPKILEIYCQKQVDNNMEISVDSCIEAHKNLFIFEPSNQ